MSYRLHKSPWKSSSLWRLATNSDGVGIRFVSTGRSDQLVLSIPRSSIYPLGAGSTSQPLFHDVQWSIEQQDAWAVLSEGSTSGKTSLLQTLVGHLKISPAPPPPGGLFPFLQGRDTQGLISLVSFAHRPRAAGAAFVDFTARYGAVREEDKRTVRETFFPEIAKPLHELAIPNMHAHPTLPVTHQVSKEKDCVRHALFEDLTTRLGLHQFLDLPIIALSNGQTRKARIIKALLDQPELLILDEPLSEQFKLVPLPIINEVLNIVLQLDWMPPLASWLFPCCIISMRLRSLLI